MVGTVGDLCEVVVTYATPPGVMQNVFGFRAISTTGTLSSLATDFKNALVKNTSGGLLFNGATVVSCSTVQSRDVKPGTLAPFDLTFSAIAGTGGADLLPPQCSEVLSWKTSLQGRSYRGRTYLPPLTEAENNAGTLISTAITNLNTIVTQMLTVFGPAGTNTDWQFGIISRVNGGVPRPTPTFAAVVSGACRSTIRTQRRRVLGVGV